MIRKTVKRQSLILIMNIIFSIGCLAQKPIIQGTYIFKRNDFKRYFSLKAIANGYYVFCIFDSLNQRDNGNWNNDCGVFKKSGDSLVNYSSRLSETSNYILKFWY